MPHVVKENVAPVGSDSKLLALCWDLLAEDALLRRWEDDDIGDDEGIAAQARWWDLVNQINSLHATTCAGAMAKADCARRPLRGLEDPCGAVDELARSVLAEVARWRSAKRSSWRSGRSG